MIKIFYCGCGLGITLLVFINLETKYKLLWLLLLLKAQLCKSFTFLFSRSACENKLYRSFIPAFHSLHFGDILSSLSPTVFGMLILSVSLKTLAILHLESLELSWRQKQKYQILQNAMLCLKQISGRRYITFNISCLWKLWIKNITEYISEYHWLFQSFFHALGYSDGADDSGWLLNKTTKPKL